MSATVAHDAVVACQRLLTYQIEHSQLVRQFPCLGFVYPHQRGVYDELLIHCKVQCHVGRLDEGIPTVGITAIVGLRDASDQVVDTSFSGKDGSDRQEEEVTTRYKRVWWSVLWFLLIHLHCGIGQGVAPQLTDERHIHLVPFHTSIRGNLSCHLHLPHMFLSVDEGQSLHLFKMFQCPEEARSAILSTAKHNESGLFIHRFHICLLFFGIPLFRDTENRNSSFTTSLPPMR